MKKRILFVTLLAAIVASVTTTSVLVIAQNGSEKIYVPPQKALQPGEMTKIPPGTPGSGLTLPHDYGPFRILPTGSVPHWMQAPFRTGVKQVNVVKTSRTSLGIADLSGHRLFLEPTYVPTGWSLDSGSTETIIWDDGQATDSVFRLGYTQTGYYPIQIWRMRIPPGEKVEIVAPGEGTPFGLTLTQVSGLPAVISHQAADAQMRINGPFDVSFVSGDIVTSVEAAGLDLDELIKIASSMAEAR